MICNSGSTETREDLKSTRNENRVSVISMSVLILLIVPLLCKTITFIMFLSKKKIREKWKQIKYKRNIANPVKPVMDGILKLLNFTKLHNACFITQFQASFSQSCTVRQGVTSTYAFWKIPLYPKTCSTALKVNINFIQKA